jgi:hypothetical protein
MAFPRSADSTPVLIEKKIAALRARLRAPTLALGGEDIGAPGYGREIRSITYRPRRMLSRRPGRLKAGRARLLSGSHKNPAAKNISGRLSPIELQGLSLGAGLQGCD